MGVKSTKTLTKKEAIDKYVELKQKLKNKEKKWHRKAQALLEDDTEKLERLLAHMNDEVNGGEGFENYTIAIWEKDE